MVDLERKWPGAETTLLFDFRLLLRGERGGLKKLSSDSWSASFALSG